MLHHNYSYFVSLKWEDCYLRPQNPKNSKGSQPHPEWCHRNRLFFLRIIPSALSLLLDIFADHPKAIRPPTDNTFFTIGPCSSLTVWSLFLTVGKQLATKKGAQLLALHSWNVKDHCCSSVFTVGRNTGYILLLSPSCTQNGLLWFSWPKCKMASSGQASAIHFIHLDKSGTVRRCTRYITFQVQKIYRKKGTQ